MRRTNSYDSMEETADPNESNFRKLVGIYKVLLLLLSHFSRV